MDLSQEMCGNLLQPEGKQQLWSPPHKPTPATRVPSASGNGTPTGSGSQKLLSCPDGFLAHKPHLSVHPDANDFSSSPPLSPELRLSSFPAWIITSLPAWSLAPTLVPLQFIVLRNQDELSEG